MTDVKKGVFVMKEKINTYDCLPCKEAGVEHEVIRIPGPITSAGSTWGADLPTTKRKCTGCGAEDGPWVSAELVGGGW